MKAPLHEANDPLRVNSVYDLEPEEVSSYRSAFEHWNGYFRDRWSGACGSAGIF